VTFNVVFMPGTAERLLPFSLSLLQSPGIRVRLVANACEPGERELLRSAAGLDDRLSEHVLPGDHPIEHGEALNHLFRSYHEPHFAFVDSDVIAGGDFMASLWPPAPGQAAVFAASTVWMTDEEGVGPPRISVLSGGRTTLHDGTFVGNTYCAIYDRAAVEPAWRTAPRGFAVQLRHRLPRELKDSLAARGWSFRAYDTARLINLQLLLAGYELDNRPVPELHHVGGVSIRSFEGSRGAVRRLAALRSSSRTGTRRVSDAVLTRLYFRLQHDRARERSRRRRGTVLAYLDEVLDAILAGDSTPPAPETDSPEVDRRVAELVTTLEDQYPHGVASLARAGGPADRGVGSA